MAEVKFISAEWLRHFSSPRGGHKRAQIEAIGLSWPPPPGWKERLVGREIDPQTAEAFERLAGDFAKPLPPPKAKKRPAPMPPVPRAEREAKKKARAAKRANKPARQRAPAARAVASVAQDEFLSSFAWRKLRLQALLKYGRRCMCCGATPEAGAVMNVDHIKPRKLWPSLALDINNLQVLCADCNHGKGNWSQRDFRR